MAVYVDGFVLVVPRRKIAAYVKIARQAGKVWMEHGAAAYRECAGDDLDTKGMGKPFPRLAGAKKGEVVFFSYIEYKSRAHRDKVNAKVMADPRMKMMMEQMKKGKEMPFDMKKMSYGGFKALVTL